MRDVHQGLKKISPPTSFSLGAGNNVQKHWQENALALISNSRILAYSYRLSKTCKFLKIPILLITFVRGQ